MDLEKVFKLTVGQVRDIISYAPADEPFGDAVEGMDFDYILGTDDDYDDMEDDSYEDYEDEDEDEEIGADPLEDDTLEALAHALANDVYNDAYQISVVKRLYGNYDGLVDRVCYLVDK